MLGQRISKPNRSRRMTYVPDLSGQSVFSQRENPDSVVFVVRRHLLVHSQLKQIHFICTHVNGDVLFTFELDALYIFSSDMFPVYRIIV